MPADSRRDRARSSRAAGLPGFILGLAIALPGSALAEESWHPGMIDAETRAATTTARLSFQQCIAAQLDKLEEAPNADPRRTTNLLINQCVAELKPIDQAHREGAVPQAFTDRFLMKIRTDMVRQLLPMMQHRAAQGR